MLLTTVPPQNNLMSLSTSSKVVPQGFRITAIHSTVYSSFTMAYSKSLTESTMKYFNIRSSSTSFKERFGKLPCTIQYSSHKSWKTVLEWKYKVSPTKTFAKNEKYPQEVRLTLLECEDQRSIFIIIIPNKRVQYNYCSNYRELKQRKIIGGKP